MKQQEKQDPMSHALEVIDEALRKNDEQYQKKRDELLRLREAAIQISRGQKKKAAGRNGSRLIHSLRAVDIGTRMAGDLAGVRLTDAIAAVLNNASGSLLFVDLKDALEKRGVRLGVPEKPQRYAANLKTAVVNNKKKFKYDKRTDMVSLVSKPNGAMSATA